MAADNAPMMGEFSWDKYTALLDEMGVDEVRIIRTTETPHFTATKAEEGMQINFVEMPQEWTGDTDASYADRYPGYRFYGEEAAKGLS